MRILLVKPKARLGTVLGLQGLQILEPLELGYLAAALHPGHDIRVLDLRLFRFHDRALRRALQRFCPHVVGFTCYSHEGSAVKSMAAECRRLCPGASVLVGGHHATVAPEDLETEAIDAVVRGEGCAPFRTIIGRLEAGDSLEGIEHVLTPGNRGAVGPDARWPQFPDPAELPHPRRDLWNPRHYHTVWLGENLPSWHPLFPQTSMVRTSWGCRMKCSFCIVPLLCSGQHRARPVTSVVEEIASLASDHVYFSDDENFIDEDFAAELAAELARRGVEKRYFAWVRSTTVNRSPELMRQWRSAGLDAAFVGFEFPTDAELKQAAKGGTVAGNERALDTLRSMGIAVHAAFMVRPEYTHDDFDRLEQYVAELPPCECSFTVCTPSPGTPDYREIEARIWVDNPHDFHDCMHPLTPTSLPLPEFARRYARLVKAGTANVPMRVHRQPIRPRDILKIAVSEHRYRKSFRGLHRDYPRHLWGD